MQPLRRRRARTLNPETPPHAKRKNSQRKADPKPATNPLASDEPEGDDEDLSALETLQPGYRLSCGGFQADIESVAFISDTKQENTRIWFLSAVGTQQSCRTIAAKMLKPMPDNAVLHPNRAATREQWPWHFTTARDPDCPSPWTFTVKRLPETRAWHLVITPLIALYNRQEPEFLLLSPTRDEPEAETLAALHYAYIDRRTREPIHRAWADWLWARALDRKEAIRLDGTGRPAWLCNPDMALLASNISEAILQGELTA